MERLMTWCKVVLVGGLVALTVASVGTSAVTEDEGGRPGPKIERPGGVSRLVPAAHQKQRRSQQRSILTRYLETLGLPRPTTQFGRAIRASADDSTQPAAAAPTRLWVKRYRNVQGNLDKAEDMVVTPDGSVYVTGYSSDDATLSDVITIKYASDGTAEWRRRYHFEPGSREQGNGVAVDSHGNVYVAGQLDYHLVFNQYLFLKYSPTGKLLWARRMPSAELGGYGNAMALAVEVDDSDNVYFTGRAGSAQDANSGYDIVTLKFDLDGNEVWRHRYSGMPVGGWGDEPAELLVDPLGDLVIGGESPGSRGDADWLVMKVDSEGRTMWHRHQRSSSRGRDEVRALALDAGGYIYATGRRHRPRGDADMLTVKYSPVGSTQWIRSYDGAGRDDDEGLGIAVDEAGDVFVTGSARNGERSDGGTTFDAVTVKYDSSGKRQWSDVISSATRWQDQGRAALPVGDGGVYVAGYQHQSAGGFNFMTVRYSADGDIVWKALYDGPGHNTDLASLLGMDEAGDLYVTGLSYGRLSFDFATVKYTER